MNTKLVDSPVQIIKSLTIEEPIFLEGKLQTAKNKLTWQENQQQLMEFQKKISERRGGKPFDPPPEEIIHQMREERTEQIMNACFPELAQSQLQEEKEQMNRICYD
jgi:hypothetical protein